MIIDVHHHWMPRLMLDECARYLPAGYQATL